MQCRCGNPICGALNKQTGKCFHQVKGDVHNPKTKMVCVHCGKRGGYCERKTYKRVMQTYVIPYLRIQN